MRKTNESKKQSNELSKIKTQSIKEDEENFFANQQESLQKEQEQWRKAQGRR